MKKNIFIILIIVLMSACAKPVVDTKKEAGNVREEVSKIAAKNMVTTKLSKTVTAVAAAVPQKKVNENELDLSLLAPSSFTYPFEKRRDPFYSLMLEREKIKAELEEKKKKEEEERKKAELGINMLQEEWKKIEILAILGDGKEYLVLFGGDDTIYQKNDYIDKNKTIKIVNINKNSVDLVMNRNGRIMNKQIIMKTEK